jgi:hypothetical protein
VESVSFGSNRFLLPQSANRSLGSCEFEEASRQVVLFHGADNKQVRAFHCNRQKRYGNMKGLALSRKFFDVERDTIDVSSQNETETSSCSPRIHFYHHPA